MTDNSALNSARDTYSRLFDNLQRAGVKIRIADMLQHDPALDLDSVFIKSVVDELHQRPLP